ncbi:MAG: hypothetical protein IMZ47_09790 [Firmicutes bacterium]|nr:hypothetical protein [Bacillota bacterium]
MAYKLRFVQKISQKDKSSFLELERKFIELERNNPNMPQGKRYLPISGKEPSNTLIWECEFETLEELLKQFNTIYDNPDHEELLQKQVLYMEDSYTEIYEVFSL